LSAFGKREELSGPPRLFHAALAGIVAFARLHDQALLLRRQMNLAVEAVGVVEIIGCVAKAVLVPQVLVDFFVNSRQRLPLGDAEETAAGLAGDLLQHSSA